MVKRVKFDLADGGDVLVRPGALHYMLGKITFAAEADKATAPAVVRYSGTGYMITEPSRYYFHFLQVDGCCIFDNNTFYACEGSLSVKNTRMKGKSSMAGDGLYQKKVEGKGWVLLCCGVPPCEIHKIKLQQGEQLTVDGNDALMWSESVSVTVKLMGNSWKAHTGEGSDQIVTEWNSGIFLGAKILGTMTCTPNHVFSHKYYIFTVIVLTVFTDNLFYSIVIPMLPVYQHMFNVSQTMIGVFTAVFPVAVCVAAPVVGWSVDRIGSRKTVLYGCIALEAATIIYALSPYFWLLMVARILQGISASITWTAGMALIPSIVAKEEQGFFVGNLMVGAGVGAMLGPVIGGALSDYGGVAAPFYMSIAIIALEIVALFFSQIAEKNASENKEGILSLLKDLGIVTISLVNLASGFMYSLVEPVFPFLFKANFGFSSFGIGMMYGAMMIAFTVSSPLIGWLADNKIPKHKPEILLLGITAVGLLLPLCALNNLVAVIFVLIFAGIFNSGSTLAAPMLNNIVDCRYKGQLYGAVASINTLVWNFGAIVGPVIGGFSAEKIGALNTLLIQSIFILVFTVFPFAIILIKFREKIFPQNLSEEKQPDEEKQGLMEEEGKGEEELEG